MMKYAKLIVAGVAAGAVALQAALTESTVTGQELLAVLLAALGAAGVWAVPNKPTSSGE